MYFEDIQGNVASKEYLIFPWWINYYHHVSPKQHRHSSEINSKDNSVYFCMAQNYIAKTFDEQNKSTLFTKMQFLPRRKHSSSITKTTLW